MGKPRTVNKLLSIKIIPFMSVGEYILFDWLDFSLLFREICLFVYRLNDGNWMETAGRTI